MRLIYSCTYILIIVYLIIPDVDMESPSASVFMVLSYGIYLNGFISCPDYPNIENFMQLFSMLNCLFIFRL